MGLNIEIKVRHSDLNTVEEIILKNKWPAGGIELQKDTFFNVPNGRLKLREINDEQAVLIPYLRPDSDKPRHAEYVLLKADDPDQTVDILKRMLGIRLIVKKKRRIFFYENVRIHLDWVDSLGSFIELEGVITKKEEQEKTHAKVLWLMKMFDIKPENIIKEAYVDIMERRINKNA
jgi:predicted adenylyl cyclase CyaB